jgi:AraC-like DNA-binding protein
MGTARDIPEVGSLSRKECARGVVSDYREYRVQPPLAGHVFCLWTQSIIGTQGVHEQRILPDACIDIVQINSEPAILVGPWTESFVARFSPGTMVVGARCHPGQAAALLGLPASELLNCSVALKDVWTSTRGERFERIAENQNLAARLVAMESALLKHLSNAAPMDLVMKAATQWISSHPQGRVDELAGWMDIGKRQLHRRFVASVGYGPKLFQSVLRFQRLLKLCENAKERLSLAETSGEAGYADQAHMTREVQRFAGVTPSALLPSSECALRLSNLLQAT